MLPIRPLALLGALLCAGTAQAQTAAECPQLPPGATVRWEVQPGPDFVFCRAMEIADGQQAFAVTVGRSATFKPRRTDRVGDRVTIDGTPTWWHAPDNELLAGTMVRETLLELPSGDYAHIIVRARDDAALTRSLRDAEALHFSDVRFGSK
ncbi:hypothetical protein [Luteimonas terrae]|uniref:Uncharacterized protein n=1 Tax=Luteimonas terrae TaxID=1530191 RepID=A0ABU1Y0C2_9GAMM|nr:hypothetical protein [Luteimonas terrae]MDR7194461.1 hypothetical protein [Luteimonas terrae]